MDLSRVILIVEWFVLCSTFKKSTEHIRFRGSLRNIKPERRVIGGAKAAINSHPHSAFLMIGKLTCGGSILTSRTILSVAHCFRTNYTGKYGEKGAAFLGHENPHKALQVLKIIDVKVHEGYVDYDHDIAIGYLERHVYFGPTIKKVVLGTKEYVPGIYGTVAGWGVTKLVGTSKRPRILRKIEMLLQSKQECERVYNKLTQNMICVGGHNNSKTTFKGDSGSALIVDGYIQIGIVSYGRYWLTALKVFTSIPTHLTWIENTVRNLHKTHCPLWEFTNITNI